MGKRKVTKVRGKQMYQTRLRKTGKKIKGSRMEYEIGNREWNSRPEPSHLGHGEWLVQREVSGHDHCWPTEHGGVYGCPD